VKPSARKRFRAASSSGAPTETRSRRAACPTSTITSRATARKSSRSRPESTSTRFPPTAGSASGVLPNPVGYNRVYVHLDEPFSHGAWFRALGRGRSFVTNGPILLVEVDGKLPGEVLHATAGRAKRLAVDVRVESSEPLEAIEIIVDGRIERRWAGDEIRPWLRDDSIALEKSGWILVRAITTETRTFRFASTAPFWVEFPDRPRTIRAEDTEFFIDWIDERIRQIEADRFETLGPSEKESVLAPHRRARKVFEALRDEARP
jgi:hypothetical protein